MDTETMRQEECLQELINHYRHCIARVKSIQADYEGTQAEVQHEVDKAKACIAQVEALGEELKVYTRIDEAGTIARHLHNHFGMWALERMVGHYSRNSSWSSEALLSENLASLNTLAHAEIGKNKIKIRTSGLSMYDRLSCMPAPLRTFQNGYSEYPKTDQLLELIEVAKEAQLLRYPHLAHEEGEDN